MQSTQSIRAIAAAFDVVTDKLIERADQYIEAGDAKKTAGIASAVGLISALADNVVESLEKIDEVVEGLRALEPTLFASE